MQPVAARWKMLPTFVPSCIEIQNAENIILHKCTGFQLKIKSVASHSSTGGCQNSLKPVSSNQTLALAAAATTAMVSVEPEAPQGPSVPSVQPCHVLTFSPIKIPVLASPFPGKVTPGGTKEQVFMLLCFRARVLLLVCFGKLNIWGM